MKNNKIPQAAIPRLSMYYRSLRGPLGEDFVSSKKISTLTGFSADQVRKDLAYFGQFGAPGKGYQIDILKRSLINILGTNRKWSVALVGVGNLGLALLSYKGFLKQGFRIICAFDNDIKKIGKNIKGVDIKDIKNLASGIKLKKIDMAIVAVPQEDAIGVINKLVNLKVRAILNFAPVRPPYTEGVQILNIDLSIELERLAYFLSQQKKASSWRRNLL